MYATQASTTLPNFISGLYAGAGASALIGVLGVAVSSLDAESVFMGACIVVAGKEISPIMGGALLAITVARMCYRLKNTRHSFRYYL